MPKYCYQDIMHHYPSLTETERKVADYILANGEKVVQMSIDEFASRAGVVKSAVVRCCKSLGFNGYSHLKIVLSADLSEDKHQNYTPYIYQHDDLSSVLEKVILANVKAIQDTLTQLDHATILKVLEAIRNANNIYVYGIGTSASIASELQYRLMQMGYTAFSYQDPASIKITSLNITEKDLVIGISYTGRSIYLVDMFKLAAQKGAKTVSITSYPDSPITKLSDHSIVVMCDEIRFPVEAMSSKIAQLSLVYAITTALSAMDYEKTVERAKESRDLLSAFRFPEDN